MIPLQPEEGDVIQAEYFQPREQENHVFEFIITDYSVADNRVEVRHMVREDARGDAGGKSETVSLVEFFKLLDNVDEFTLKRNF